MVALEIVPVTSHRGPNEAVLGPQPHILPIYHWQTRHAISQASASYPAHPAKSTRLMVMSKSGEVANFTQIQ